MRPESHRPLHIFANIADGVWAVDMNQRIVFWNNAAEQLLGIREADALGRRCWALLAGADRQGKPVCCHNCQNLLLARQGKPVPNFERIARCADGRTALINISTLFVPESEEVAPLDGGYVVHLFRKLGDGPELGAGLRIHLLGHTVVALPDGTRVQGPLWQRAKVRALFALLAASHGRWLDRDFLINTFWPDRPYASACHNLNTTVYNLRRSLGPALRQPADSEFILYHRDHYRLNGDRAHWLDVEAFEDALQLARRQESRRQAIPLYRRTLAYYRGEFQEDLEPEWAWHRARRIQLHQLYLAAFQELGGLYESLQEDDQAIQIYLQALDADPCFEAACRRLMRLHLRQGDWLAAVTRYHHLADALEQELDVRPGKKTRRLYRLAASSR